MSNESQWSILQKPAKDEAQKLVIYVMPAKGMIEHKFIALRTTTKNPKGRYVTGPQFDSFGLRWPTSLAKTRDDLALLIGRSILTAAGV